MPAPVVSDYPTRLRILRALTDALRTITPTNGYVHDLSESVYRGRVMFGESDALPMVAILENPLQPEQLSMRVDKTVLAGPWELLIQGFVDDDQENPTDPAYTLVYDVIRRLIVEKRRNRTYSILGMGQDVTDIVLGVPVVRPPDEISAKAYFWLPITLTLAEDFDKPYEYVPTP